MIMPLPGKPTPMTRKLASIAILILLSLAFCSACTTPTGGGVQPPGRTPVPTTGQPQTPTQTAGQIYPGPTVTVPTDFNVEIQENRNHNPIHPDITVTFRGGKGQIFLQKMVGVVVRSDGQVITKELDRPENGQLSVGDSMTFTGTTGVDRVIVVDTILGKDYKIMDINDDYNLHP